MSKQVTIKFYGISNRYINYIENNDRENRLPEAALRPSRGAAPPKPETTGAPTLTEKLYSNIIHSNDARTGIGVY